MTIIFDTMEPSMATLCGYDDPTDTDQGGIRIEHDALSDAQQQLTIFGQEGEVSFIGESECKLAIEAMARAIGYKLVKIGGE